MYYFTFLIQVSFEYFMHLTIYRIERDILLQKLYYKYLSRHPAMILLFVVFKNGIIKREKVANYFGNFAERIYHHRKLIKSLMTYREIDLLGGFYYITSIPREDD